MRRVELTREQVLAHRLHALGLVGRAAAVTDLAVLDLGVQKHAAGIDAGGVVYLRLFAPASDADVAGFLGTSRAAAAPDRPADLVPVRVDGRAAAAPPEVLDAIRRAEVPRQVRLLPPSDPWLQGRDREVLVPDAALRRRIWPSLGPPGVVLSGVDVVGLWRTTQRGRTLQVVVDGELPAGIDEEAQRLAGVRGTREVTVTRS